MQKKIGVVIVVAVVLIVGAILWYERGTQSLQEKNADRSQKISVVTSFYPLYFFAKEIAQDTALVQNITPSGAEPHDYEPTSQDMARIEKSNLLILNGGGLEAWGENIKENIDQNHTVIVVAGEGLTTGTVVENGQTRVDPHVWLSPILAQKMVEKITQGFVQADPLHKDAYLSNAQALKTRLSDLDSAYKQGLAHCTQKDIITSHAAFGYLALTYGLRQVSITGLSPDAEPSSKELGNIVTFAKENNVKYIFFESLVSPKLAQTIATEVGAQTLVLNPIEGLSESEISSGKSYLTEMQNNLSNLKTALECNQ